MLEELTFSMIKPDATKRNITGKINSYLENCGLKIVAQKMLFLNEFQVSKFYEEHKQRDFFKSLVKFMTSGSVIVQVLKGIDAINKNRKVMGATDPKLANIGTIRRDFAQSIEANSIHGSDTLENAKKEISFFFSELEIFEN